MNCIDCELEATHRLEDLDFCDFHYKTFKDELEVKSDIYSEDTFATD